MEKAIQFTTKLFLSLIMITFVSCGDDFALTKKYYYVNEKSKEWLINDSLATMFEMVDNNAITYVFKGDKTKQSLNEGASGFLFVTTKKSFQENYYYSSISNYGTSFSMYLYASYLDDSEDVLHLYVDNITVHINLKTAKIDYFGCRQNNVKWTQTDENDKNSVFVRAEFVDSINVRDYSYKGVLHCCIKDNVNALDPNDMTEIYYAKGVGLIKYTLKSNIIVERKTTKIIF